MHQEDKRRSLELLAPAKNLDCGIAAIDHGADAVYIGANRFGARANAGNTVEDIAQLCEYAHQFLAKVYVTINTIIYDHELRDIPQLIAQLQQVGVDAFLIQDMSFLQSVKDKTLSPPPILHASTQIDNRTAEKVGWLASWGIRRVVLARELSLKDIRQIHQTYPNVELEAFVHGALCVSYSGVCYASQYCFNRSANRGECAQFCRLKFDLLDGDGNELIHQRHLLSLKDLCRIDHLEELAAAGVISFKIEGRLKDVSYVKNVVAAYRQGLDRLIAKYPQRYRRASLGASDIKFKPDLQKTFNRGYTSYFLHGRKRDIASHDTPKKLGERVGTVRDIRKDSFSIAGISSFSNGDGLCFFNQSKDLEGLRVNRVEGNRIYPFKMPASLKQGMSVYRNYDMAFEKSLSGQTAVRKIPVTLEYQPEEQGFSIRMLQEDNTLATVSLPAEKSYARVSQRDNIMHQFMKLGTTRYRCVQFNIKGDADKYFVPNHLLADMKHKLIRQADQSLANMASERRRSPVVPFSCKRASDGINSGLYHDVSYLYNVSNQMSRRFYESQGLEGLSCAFEQIVGTGLQRALLMQCRYCLLYELGYCRNRKLQQPLWKDPLFLRLSDGRRFRLQFMCDVSLQQDAQSLPTCQMNVYAE